MPFNSGSITDFTNTAISNTYQRVVQTDGTLLADGTGSILDNLNLPNLSISGNLYVSGTLYAENTVTVTQSYYSGSQIFGDQLTDTHRFTGSILSTGSNVFNGVNTFTGSVNITGSLNINGVDYNQTSASFDTRILNNSSSIALLSGSFESFSGSYLIDSASFSSSIAFLSSSYLFSSASFDTRILNNSSSIALLSGSFESFSGSYLLDSASFDTRILNNSSSIAFLSGSYLFSSASFDTRILNNSSSIAYLSSSFLTFSGSYNTGSFTGSFTGSLFGTSSYALNALTASHALTASSADSFVVRNSFTASGLRYPIADNGEFSFIQTDGLGNLSLQYVNTLYEVIVNGETTTITKGTPVYVSGSQGANSIVYRADAGNPAKMPVIYISADNIAAGDTGRGVVLGLITGVNTTGYPAGTEIFVAVGGGYTATRPTGSAIVQVLGIVTKEGNGGQGVVLNPGPANLPNLPSGSVWVGNSGSFPTAVLTSSLSVASASFAISASYALTASYVPIIDGGTF